MYIKKQYRKNLEKYKYSGIDKSLLSHYVLNHYWNWLVTQFPLWMAPNLITFIGFLICVFNLATLLVLSPDLKEPCPNWVYLTFSFGLFAYQSLDAIDGKQARRTGSGGPLGELFDHGCDALNTTIGTLLGTSMLNAHQSWWLAIGLYAALANFYLSTWEEYHTGTLYLGYVSGPVEGVIILVCAHFFTGIVGPVFWEKSVASFILSTFGKTGVAASLASFIPAGVQFNHLLISTSLLVTIVNAVTSIINVSSAHRKKNESVLPALTGLLPFVTSGLFGFAWLKLRPDMVTKNLVVFTLFVGVTFGYTVGRMITAHVTKAPFPIKPNALLILLLVGSTNAIVESVTGSAPLWNKENDITYLWSIFAISCAVYLHFAWDVIEDICDFKNIHCFRLGKRKGVTKKGQ